MADDIVIRIKTLLDRASQEDLNKVKSDIEQRVNPKIKVDVDTKDLNKISQKFEQTQGSVAGITQKTKEWSNALHETVKQTEYFKAGSDEVTKKVTETTIGLKKQRDELAKINTEQSKYWSQRVKETVGDMTKKPDELVKMADYYDNLEKTNLETIKNAQNKNFNEAKQHLTQLNRLRQDYYKISNKDTEEAKELRKQMSYHQGQYNNIIRRKIDIGEKTKVEGMETEKLIQLEKIREQTLRNVGTIKAKNIDKDIIQQQKLTSEIHKQNLEQQKMLDNIRGMRGKSGAFIVGDNLTNLNALENKIRGFDPTDKNFSKNMREAQLELQKINTSMGIYKKEISDANKFTGVFGQSLLEAGKKFASWLLIGDVIIGTIRFFKDGVKYVAELDNAMNQLRIVMNLSNEQAIELGRNYNSLAKEMSVTTTEIAKAAVEFARQGLTLEQMDDRLRNTIKYAKISGMEFQEAAEIITASVNSMGVETQRAIDIFSYMGDATATGKHMCPAA